MLAGTGSCWARTCPVTTADGRRPTSSASHPSSACPIFRSWHVGITHIPHFGPKSLKLRCSMQRSLPRRRVARCRKKPSSRRTGQFFHFARELSRHSGSSTEDPFSISRSIRAMSDRAGVQASLAASRFNEYVKQALYYRCLFSSSHICSLGASNDAYACSTAHFRRTIYEN